jgi:nickel-dependent lactate racemase
MYFSPDDTHYSADAFLQQSEGVPRSRIMVLVEPEMPEKSMRVGIDYGLDHVDLEVAGERMVPISRAAPVPCVVNPVDAVREALERPSGFPSLRQALTPDDHVAVVVDEHLLQFPEFITPVLEHIVSARVAPESISIVCPSGTAPGWDSELPDVLRKVRIEVHDPTERQRLAYLATTKRGRRIYLNRTAVDADQLVVLARRGFDPLLGYSGAEGALYPALSDEATRREMLAHLSLAAPGAKPWPIRKEAGEVAWLLGTPFMVQIVEGTGDSVAHVVAGLAETGDEGIRLLNAAWRVSVGAMPDLVVAGLSGDPARHTFADLAEALACAARIVSPGGRIVLLSAAAPALGKGAELLRRADDPEQALKLLGEEMPDDMTAAFQWTSAAQRATIYLLSKLPAETAEELFAIPLDHAGQAQRLIDAAKAQLFLPDAHKTLAETIAQQIV